MSPRQLNGGDSVLRTEAFSPHGRRGRADLPPSTSDTAKADSDDRQGYVHLRI